jgi:hypothetical protein
VIAADRGYVLFMGLLPLVLGMLIRLVPAKQGLAGPPGNTSAQELLQIPVTCACPGRFPPGAWQGTVGHPGRPRPRASNHARFTPFCQATCPGFRLLWTIRGAIRRIRSTVVARATGREYRASKNCVDG